MNFSGRYRVPMVPGCIQGVYLFKMWHPLHTLNFLHTKKATAYAMALRIYIELLQK